jgi:hypothetical protein
MRWGGLRQSLFDALMVNFASFIGLLLGLGPYITSSGPWGLTLFGTYSTMVEGAVLMLLERHGAKKVWWCALSANFFSCAMLGCESLYAQMHVPVPSISRVFPGVVGFCDIHSASSACITAVFDLASNLPIDRLFL